MVWTNTCSADFYKEFAKRYKTEDGYVLRVARQSSLEEFAQT